MKRPTPKQDAARKRNWHLAQLKQSISILRGFLPRDAGPELDALAERSKIAIDRRWEADKATITNTPRKPAPWDIQATPTTKP